MGLKLSHLTDTRESGHECHCDFRVALAMPLQSAQSVVDGHSGQTRVWWTISVSRVSVKIYLRIIYYIFLLTVEYFILIFYNYLSGKVVPPAAAPRPTDLNKDFFILDMLSSLERTITTGKLHLGVYNLYLGTWENIFLPKKI